MLAPAPSCRRALQRQLYTASDVVWISDEALSHVFQRFCAVSKTRKRYGSFVPGPLESRRRMGKRRMTLQSNATPTPAFGIASLWGSFGEVDRTQWQWEPPTTRDTRETRSEEAPSALPKWLVEWGITSEAVPDVTVRKISKRSIEAQTKPFRAEIARFRKVLQECNPGGRLALCEDFNRKSTQALSLGHQAEQRFSYILKFVFQDLRQAFLDSEQANQRCLALCQAMWEGISSSKVIQPSDFGHKTIGRFVAVLCDIPMSSELEALAISILSSASDARLPVIISSIGRLVETTFLSWQEEDASDMRESRLHLAVQSVSEATSAVASVETLTASLDESRNFLQDLPAFRQALKMAREAIIASSDSIQESESTIMPHQHSINSLTAILSSLPSKFLRLLIRHCSSRVLQLDVQSTKDRSVASAATVQHRWLSFVAQIPDLRDSTLLDTWKLFGPFVQQDAATDILLSHWIGRDLFKRPASMKVMFNVVTSRRNRKDPSALLHVIDGERENCWVKMRLLFRFLFKLGDHSTVFRTLLSLKNLRIRVPADVMDETLEGMAIEDPLLAQKAFWLYRYFRYNDKPLRLEKCPTFIFSMIHNPEINSSIIWRALGIPMFDSIPGSLRKHRPPGHSTLTLKVAAHITTMATHFADCEVRTQRVAFRNVMQCLFYLRKHSTPITPEFTRAMVHAGISRKISSDGWIAKERAAWILELIEKVEGTDVAITVDEIVKAWNQNMSERVSRRDRSKNVFGGGIID